MLLLDLRHRLEETGDLRETLFLRDLGEARVHRCPLLVLAVRGSFEILRRRADARDELEPDLRVLPLVARSLREKRRNLLEAVLLRTRRIVAVLRISLRLTGKCRPKILFGLRTLQFHSSSSSNRCCLSRIITPATNTVNPYLFNMNDSRSPCAVDLRQSPKMSSRRCRQMGQLSSRAAHSIHEADVCARISQAWKRS